MTGPQHFAVKPPTAVVGPRTPMPRIESASANAITKMARHHNIVMSIAAAKEQQDVAAGGRPMRELLVEDGNVVTASIEVVKIESHLWAYMRFKNGTTTTRKYVGRVTAETRAESLRLGWELVRRNRVVESFGWKWVVKTPMDKR